MDRKQGMIRASRLLGNMNLGAGARAVIPGGVVGPSHMIGNVFYVDPIGGSDANDGLAPVATGVPGQGPLATTAAALALCAANAGDIIVRMPGTETRTNAQGAINFNVRGVTLLTSEGENPAHPDRFLYSRDPDGNPASGDATGPVITITQPCVVAGIAAYADWVTAGDLPATCGADILVSGAGAAPAGQLTRLAGVKCMGLGESYGIAAAGAALCMVDHSTFMACVVGGIFICRDANPAVNPPTDLWIEDNTFDGTPFPVDTAALAVPARIWVRRNSTRGETNLVRAGGVWTSGKVEGNYCSVLAANAMDGNRAAMEAQGVFASGNFYRDQGDPRA